jgi:hypothetical protein
VISEDGSIYWDKIRKKILRNQTVFLCLPLRLGIQTITSEYLACLKQVFKLEHSCGIVGGQNDKALFFTGIINPTSAEDPYLTYLDPHFVQDSSI